MNADELRSFADRLMRALDEGDHEVAAACVAPDATWWMNGRLRGTFAAVLPELRRAKPAPTARRHEQIRRLFSPEGFTDQHVTRLGPDVELAVCVVVRVAGGRATRIEEYFDTAQLPHA
jgi:ketosteroid isomerase-like protein